MKRTDKIGKYLRYADVIKAPQGVDNTPDDKQLKAAIAWVTHIYDPVADHFGLRPFVHCVFRSKAYNATLPGASAGSQHTLGEAGDIDFDTLVKNGLKTPVPSNKELFDFICTKLDFDQVIWEKGNATDPDWVHVSFVLPAQMRKNRKKRTRFVNGKYVDFDLY